MKSLISKFIAVVFLGLVSNSMAQPPNYFGYQGLDRPSPPAWTGYQHEGRVHIERGLSEAGYQLRIHTQGGISPQAIQVKIQGNSILIENDQSNQREEKNERGYYSYTRSSSRFRRRFSVPRNADTENMQRTVEDGVITITLPFLNDHWN